MEKIKERARAKAHRSPLALYCELCPEDDKRKATQRHHLDYDHPEIFVSCCSLCHSCASIQLKPEAFQKIRRKVLELSWHCFWKLCDSAKLQDSKEKVDSAENSDKTLTRFDRAQV